MLYLSRQYFRPSAWTQRYNPPPSASLRSLFPSLVALRHLASVSIAAPLIIHRGNFLGRGNCYHDFYHGQGPDAIGRYHALPNAVSALYGVKSAALWILSDEYGCIIGGEGGIRSHVGVSPNRFRVGAGMATSVPLQGPHRISVMRGHNKPYSAFADDRLCQPAPPSKAARTGPLRSCYSASACGGGITSSRTARRRALKNVDNRAPHSDASSPPVTDTR